jgi:sugar phosphate isomerase/epimerase
MILGISDGLNHPAHAKLGEGKYLKLKQLGFGAVDYGLANIDSVFFTAPIQESRALIADVRSSIEHAGLCVSQVHGPWTWPPSYDATPEARRIRLEQMKRSIELTALLGSTYWVIHPLMPFACQDTLLHKEQEAYDINLRFMRELLPFAKHHGVTICLENMPMKHLALASPRAVLGFVREMNDSHFKICLDTGHTTMVSDGSLADTVRMLGNELRVLHVHDNNGERDEHRLTGDGIIDWHAFAGALRDISFNGVFSLETTPSKELPDEEYAAALAAIVRQLKVIDPILR